MDLEWYVDNIPLEAICERAEWHLASVEQALVAEGLSVEDARDFAVFVFCDHAVIQDNDPEDYVTPAQYKRLSVRRNT